MFIRIVVMVCYCLALSCPTNAFSTQSPGPTLASNRVGWAYQVKDINPGPVGGFETTSVVFNNMLYFTADDGSSDTSLWRSDGTSAGTTLVKSFDTRLASFYGPAELVATTTRLFFTTFDVTNGSRLWSSDGTPAGTLVLLQMPYIVNGLSGILRLTPVGNLLLFVTADTKLWRSDGTIAGTFALAAFESVPSRDGTYLPGIGEVAVTEEGIFFISESSDHRYALWFSDATVAGTRLIKEMMPSRGEGKPEYLAVVGNTAYFFSGATKLLTLWCSDGTAAGTKQITTIPGTFVVNSSFGRSTALYFILMDWSSNPVRYQIWRSDGSANGTQPISTLWNLVIGNYKMAGVRNTLFGVPETNGRAFFFEYTPETGLELWVSDGTLASTRLIADIYPGSAGSYPQDPVIVNNVLLFTATQSGDDYELWRTDGSPQGTWQLTTINTGNAAAAPEVVGFANGVVFFGADDGRSGRELWAMPIEQLAARSTQVASLYVKRVR